METIIVSKDQSNMEKSVGTQFMQATTYENLNPSGQKQGLPMPAFELPYQTNVKMVKLPEPDMLAEKEVNFLELIELRTSVRQYHNTVLTLHDLSYLLWCSQGVKMGMPETGTLRNVPSAGARHAFETYVLINHVEGIPAGLYRFLALEHVLIEVNISDTIAQEITQSFLNQKMILSSSVTFIWTAVAERMTWRYGDRGYRYLHLDAGHVCQNIYLAANTLNFGACAIAAFNDEELNKVLGVDGEKQFAIYGACIGK